MAAENITIKRYTSVNNDMQWVELYPKTKVANITDANGNNLQGLLNGKQTKLTLNGNDVGGTVDSSPSQNSTNLVSSGGVYTAINNVAAIAGGRTKSFTTTLVGVESSNNTLTYYFPVGSTSYSGDVAKATINSACSAANVIVTQSDDGLWLKDIIGGNWSNYYLYEITSVNPTTYTVKSTKLSDIAVGDIIWIIDTRFPDFWLGDDSEGQFWIMETAKVPINNYVTKTTQIAGINIGTGISTADLKSSLGITNVVNRITSGISSTTTGLEVTSNTNATGDVTITVGTSTGYAIPTSAQIAQIATNTTNISSKANDSAVVHKGGSELETITGPKMFSNDVLVGLNGNTYSSHIIDFVNENASGDCDTEIGGYNGGFIIKPEVNSSDTYFNFQPTSLLYGNDETSYEYHFPSQSGTISLNHTFLQSGTPTSANEGDIWFAT